MKKKLKVDTDIAGESIRVVIEAARAAVDDGKTTARPRVFVTADTSELCDLAEGMIEGLCLTPLQAERLALALYEAAQTARRMR